MDLLDELEIKSLITKERFARDTGQWQKLRQSYHPEAKRTRIHTMWYDGDIDGFVTGSKSLHTTTGAIIHQILPADVEINNLKAVADCWCFISARPPTKNEEYELRTCLRLLYCCEKFRGEWKLLSLEPIYINDMLSAIPPATRLEIPDLSHFRKSYRHTAWLTQQRGVDIANDLPGEDDAASVENIRKRHRDWLMEE